MIPWEIIALGVSLLVLGLSALIMATKSKKGSSITVEGIDIRALAEEVARAVGKEIAKELKDVLKGLRVSNGSGGYYQESDSEIQMDERIVPMKVEVAATEVNLQNMAKEEVKVDKGLADNKSKLANLLKKKKE